MNEKKIIHELSIDDLIALANGSSEKVIMDKVSDAAKFIYELGIKHGDAKIPAELIYHTYKVWKGWDQKRQSKPFFYRDFKKYFAPHRTTHGICYLLNPKSFDLSQETYFIIRKEQREAKAKSRKKAQR